MEATKQPVVLPTQFYPTHYKLELTPDLEKLTFLCQEEIVVNVVESTSEVTLHSKELFITSASYHDDNGTTVDVTEIAYNLKYNTVRLGFPSAVAVGSGKLVFKYSGILNSDMAGFYKSSYADADGNKKIMASTQFEALDARRAFLCWDEPAIKATFEVILIIPAHLTALSNMPETESRYLPGGKKRVSFAVSPKMSTYLLAWAVGEFDFVQAVTKHGVQLRVFSPPGRASQGKFALDAGVRALDFYDDFFQIPYPLPKMDMICVTEFAMGAMENWGLVTYREVDLMIDEAKASSQQKQRVAIVVAHELAHQWFGNLVTMAWWDGLWLNEGFAAFMEHFCVEDLYPDYKIWEQFTTDAFGAAQRLDSLRTSHPVIVPIAHAEEVEQVFDAISYCKGSTIVNMVNAVVGRDKFREGLQLYMRKHAYGNTNTSDLWQAWTDVSGIDIAAVMKTWTTRMGYPYLKVISETWGPSSVDFTLEQSWFLADGSAPTEEEAKDAIWSIPLLFSTSNMVSATAVIMTERQQSFTIPLASADDWLRINSGQKALVRVAISSEQARRLQPAIRSKQLGPVDRAALLLDAYALAKAGLAPVESVVEILRGMEDEDSSVVWDAISMVLSALHLLLQNIGGESFAAFEAFGKKFVLSAFRKVSWQGQATDSHSQKLLRSTVIGLLDTFAWNDPEIVAECRRRFDGHWVADELLPTDYRSTVYKIVLKNGGINEYEAILKSFYATEDNAVKKFAFTIGAAQSEALKLRTLDWAVKSGDVKLQDFFYPIGPVASSVTGADLAWNYVKQNLAYLKEKVSKAHPSLLDPVIGFAVNRFTTFERAAEVEAFFAANPLPSNQRRISQLIESIRSSAAMQEILSRSRLADAAFWN